MILLLLRLLLFAALAVGAYYIIRKFLEPSDSIRCSRCDGKGFWYGARGKETCDWCKGAGRLPK